MRTMYEIWDSHGQKFEANSNTTDYKIVEHFFTCDCMSHGLRIVSYDWDGDWPQDEDINIELWKCVGTGRKGVWHRIKMCWNIMWHGGDCVDDVVLKREDAKRLAEVIIELTGEN